MRVRPSEDGALWEFAGGNAPLFTVMGPRAGGELDIEPDLDTDRPGHTARPVSMERVQQLKAAAGLIQSIRLMAEKVMA